MKAEGAFFWVYESDSLEALRVGELVGRWLLGSSCGKCVGVLVWLSLERHVVRLDDPCGFLGEKGCWLPGESVAPWWRY